MEKTNFSFKILSIGSFSQILNDTITILNRPCIFLENEKKRYGNEYLLFKQEHQTAMEAGKEIFLGFFGIDKNKNRKYIRFYKNLKIPIKIPDYFVISFKHSGDKLDKDFDFIKTDPNSFSQIFSSAFCRDDTKEDFFNCESIFVVKNGDIVKINKKIKIFSAKDEKFIEI